MESKSPTRNLAIVSVLIALYVVPALFLSPQTMLDIISVPMLVFGMYGLYLLSPETWRSFWDGDQSRAAVALYGLSSLLLSVVIMRPYGIADRNIPSLDWLSTTHIFPIALFIQAIGLMLFTRASSTPKVGSKRSGVGQLVAGIVIGALVASSRVLEHVFVFIGKILSRIF